MEITDTPMALPTRAYKNRPSPGNPPTRYGLSDEQVETFRQSLFGSILIVFEKNIGMKSLNHGDYTCVDRVGRRMNPKNRIFRVTPPNSKMAISQDVYLHRTHTANLEYDSITRQGLANAEEKIYKLGAEASQRV